MTEEELALWHRCRDGDLTACEELILWHATQVVYWVKKIHRRAPWTNPEDLIQEGTLGLITAVKRFDPDLGWEFSTFARHHICGKIFDSNELTGGQPKRQHKIHSAVMEAHDLLAIKLERKPTVEEIGRELGLSTSKVMNAIRAAAIGFATPLTESDARLGMRSEPALMIAADQEKRVVIQDALSRLSEKEAHILIWHAWYGESDDEVAKRLTMSPVAVARARQRALKKLSKLLE